MRFLLREEKMRFFKHGDSLAIVLPEPLRKSSSVHENDEYEFFEVEPGVFVLVSRFKLAEDSKKSVFAELLSRCVAQETPQARPQQALQTPSTPLRARANSPLNQLDAKGFLVIENEEDAKALSRLLERDIKAGSVRGVRGFDKKFYVVSSSFLEKASSKLLPVLSGKEPLTASRISASTGLEEAACIAALQVLKEDGEVLEKKKGFFVAVK
ncbi:MAG: AbrB/MazE/SpoVT family DNA-binding domain-containing protein [Candidatus Micrarchaeia archaeon]